MNKVLSLVLSVVAVSFTASVANATALSFHMNEKGMVVTQQVRSLPGEAQLTIDGIRVKGITQIDGTSDISGHDTVEYKDPEDMTTRYRPGNNKTGRIKITREWSNDTTFVNWAQASEKKEQRKSISIIFLSDDGTEGVLTLNNAVPTGWSGPAAKSLGSAHAVESIELVYENFDYKK